MKKLDDVQVLLDPLNKISIELQGRHIRSSLPELLLGEGSYFSQIATRVGRKMLGTCAEHRGLGLTRRVDGIASTPSRRRCLVKIAIFMKAVL